MVNLTIVHLVRFASSLTLTRANVLQAADLGIICDNSLFHYNVHKVL